MGSSSLLQAMCKAFSSSNLSPIDFIYTENTGNGSWVQVPYPYGESDEDAMEKHGSRKAKVEDADGERLGAAHETISARSP